MKLTKDSANVSTIEGSSIKVVDLEGNGDYYALMSMLTGHMGLSYGIIQRAATKLGCYKDVRDAFCVPLHMLHALSCELRKRYPRNTKVQELYAATLPALPQSPPDAPLSPQAELLTREEKDDEVDDEQDFYTVLPKELKEWTFDAMKNSESGWLTQLYNWVAESESTTLQELWGNYVYELHKLDEFYPKLPVRLTVIPAHRAKPLGKLKLLQV